MDIDFVVIGPARSGSSLFCKLLSEHPNVKCEMEHFYKSRYEKYAKQFKTDDVFEIFKILNKKWMKSQLDLFKETKKVIGFKFLFSNIHSKTEKLYTSLLKDKDIKKILITRNPLEVYISNKICEISTVDKKNWLGTKLHGTKITFNKNHFICKTEIDNNRYMFALKNIQGNLITIDYKDICNTTCFKKIHDFLNVSYVPTQLPSRSDLQGARLHSLDWGKSTTKQNYTQMSYKIENFEEMVEYISTTPYKNCLI